MRPLAPNALLEILPSGPSARLDAIGQARLGEVAPSWLAVLEAMLHTSDIEVARHRAEAAAAAAPDGGGEHLEGTDRLERARQVMAAGGLVLVAARGLRVLPEGLHGVEGHITLTRLSERRSQVLPALLGVQPATVSDVAPGPFAAAVEVLTDFGLLVPPVGQLDWGDMRRRAPVCQVFGAGRGTPIDRYYLDRFVEEVREQIAGAVIDVGGHRADRVRFRLAAAASVRVLDMAARDHVDIVADVHDLNALPEGSADSVLLFNVLEHCVDPRTVAANVHAWLRPGGRCFVMVPNAQRLHDAPADYWRFSAAGLQTLFGDFAETTPYTYGNLTTVLANHVGVAAEELSADDLDHHQPDHPVATCLVAVR